MHPVIVERPAETVFFVREMGDYAVTPQIAFQKLVQHLPKTQIEGFYGMGIDNPRVTEKQLCRYDACAKVRLENSAELADCVQKKEINGGRFALFIHEGPYAELSRTCEQIFQEWFPTSGYVPANFLVFCEYPKDFLEDSIEERTTKIFVPIESNRSSL